MSKERLKVLVPLVARIAAWVIIGLAVLNVGLAVLTPRAASAPATIATPPPVVQPAPQHPQPVPSPPATPTTPGPSAPAAPAPAPLPDLAIGLSTKFATDYAATGVLRVVRAIFARTDRDLSLAMVVVADQPSRYASRAVLVGIDAEQTALVTAAGKWFPVRSATNLALLRGELIIQRSPEFPWSVPRTVWVVFPLDTPAGRLNLRLVWRFAKTGDFPNWTFASAERVVEVEIP